MLSEHLDALAHQFGELQRRGMDAAPTRPSPETKAADNKKEHSNPLVARLRRLEEKEAAPERQRAALALAHDALYAERHALQVQRERRDHNTYLLEKRHRDAFAEERRARRESEIRHARLADERTASLLAAVAHEKREREEAEASFASELGEITASLRAERLERERRLAALGARHEQHVRSLQHALAREREARETQARATISTLDDLLNRVRAELRAERHGEAGSTDGVLKLLEEGVDRAREHATRVPTAAADEQGSFEVW